MRQGAWNEGLQRYLSGVRAPVAAVDGGPGAVEMRSELRVTADAVPLQTRNETSVMRSELWPSFRRVGRSPSGMVRRGPSSMTCPITRSHMVQVPSHVPSRAPNSEDCVLQSAWTEEAGVLSIRPAYAHLHPLTAAAELIHTTFIHFSPHLSGAHLHPLAAAAELVHAVPPRPFGLRYVPGTKHAPFKVSCRCRFGEFGALLRTRSAAD